MENGKKEGVSHKESRMLASARRHLHKVVKAEFQVRLAVR